MKQPFATLIGALIGLSIATLTGCGAGPANAPKNGEIVTRHDPRDRDQCAAQPKLAWCENARKAGDIR